MESADGVLLLTRETETTQAVASALESSERLTPGGVCHFLTELAAQLERSPARAVLVDIDPQPSRMLAELGPIVARFPNARFVVLSRDMRNDLILEAMQIGARHYLVKQSIHSDLVEVLERLVPNGQPRVGARGSLFTVLSAGGGCGATTVAINLANELGKKASSPALVVDMDCTYGAVASCLGLSGEYSLADVLTHERQIDDELIISTARVYSPALHVLLSSASVNHADPAPLNYDRLDSALEAFQLAYYHTIIDAARVPMSVAAALASVSKLTLLVLQLNVKDLANARAMLDVLTRHGIPTDAILLLINRYHRRNQMISLEEAQKALGISVRRVCNDFPSASRSINCGQPLAEAAPRSSLRRELQGLAVQLVNSQAMADHADRR